MPRPGQPADGGDSPDGRPARVVLPAEVVSDAARAVGAEVTVVGRLSGGVNAGAVRVRLGGGPDAVLKAEPRTHPGQLDRTRRARRVVEHMRARGYPTPAWLGMGSTPTHVWHLAEFVDADPVRELTPALVDQLAGIVEIQAGEGSEPPDHSSYAWRVVTGREPVLAGLAGYSPAVSALVERVRRVSADAPPPTAAPDMVHADLNPGNVLVRDAAVVAVVDIGNAGRGTRATDLTTLLWHTAGEPLAGARERLWERILARVGWQGAAVLAATQVLLQLDWTTRLGFREAVDVAVDRGDRVLGELTGLR